MDTPFPPLPLPQGHFPQWGMQPQAPAPGQQPAPGMTPAMPGLLAQLLGNQPGSQQPDINSLLAALRAKHQQPMQPAAPMISDFGSANGATGSGGDAAGGVSGSGGIGGSATGGAGGSAAAGVGGDDGGTY